MKNFFNYLTAAHIKAINRIKRDILEAISEDYNPIMKKVPSNEGIFKVNITWTPE